MQYLIINVLNIYHKYNDFLKNQKKQQYAAFNLF
jgi:hypothetical protein